MGTIVVFTQELGIYPWTNRVRLFHSTIINSQSSWCTEFKFSGKMHNNAKILFVYFGWKYFSFETVMVLHGSTAETLQRTKFCSLRVSVVTKWKYLTPKFSL